MMSDNGVEIAEGQKIVCTIGESRLEGVVEYIGTAFLDVIVTGTTDVVSIDSTEWTVDVPALSLRATVAALKPGTVFEIDAQQGLRVRTEGGYAVIRSSGRGVNSFTLNPLYDERPPTAEFRVLN